MKRALIIGLILLMLVLPMASARELSVDEINKIKSDAKATLNKIKSFQMDIVNPERFDYSWGGIIPQKNVTIRYKSPNLYLIVTFF